MTCIHDVPSVCIASIATFLEHDDLVSFSVACNSINNIINDNKNYIQQVRTYDTFTANPYRHCFIDNECDAQSHKPYINPTNILEEVKDMCDMNDIQIEEYKTRYICPYTCFQYRFDNGKDGYYITDVHIKAHNIDHVWFIYGSDALRVEFYKNLLVLVQKDSDGYYHLYSEFLLLVPKLYKGFTDLSSNFFLEIKSSGIASIRVIKHKIDMNKAIHWIEKFNPEVKITMPRVQCHNHICSSSESYEFGFQFASGVPVAICINIQLASTGLPIDPSMIEMFTVGYWSTKSRTRKDVGKFKINTELTHCSLVQKYIQWPFQFKDCLIIPVKTRYRIDGYLYVEVLLKNPIDTRTNAFYLMNYESIYFNS